MANPIDDQTATVGTALNYAFPTNTFADTDTGDTLTYTATQSDDSALPSWLSFAAATRTFSGTPTAAETVSVKVTASDGTDSVSDTFDIVVSTAANTPPVFATATATRSFTESVGPAQPDAVDVGAVVTATDADGDTLTYSLEGTDAAKFSIDSSGQIRTQGGLNFDRETKASYSVTVKADDGNGGTDTIAVTITVDNAVEKPLAPGMPTVTATSGSTTSLDVSWAAPLFNTGRPAITGYKVEYRAGVSGSWTNHPHTGTGRTATITGLTAATSYQVHVLAVNSDGDGPFSGPGSRDDGHPDQRRPDGGVHRAPDPDIFSHQRGQPDLAGDVQRGGLERGCGGFRGERDHRHAVGQRGLRGDGRVRCHRERGQPGQCQRHGHPVH